MASARMCQYQLLENGKPVVNLLLTRHCYVHRKVTNENRFRRIELQSLPNGNCKLGDDMFFVRPFLCNARQREVLTILEQMLCR